MAVIIYVPSELGEGYFTDVPAPGAGDNAKALTYNHATTAFVYTAFETSGAVATHVGLADPHTQYLLESGVSAYGATLIDDADAATARTTLGLGTIATGTETNYLLASGTRTGATSQIQQFSYGAKSSVYRAIGTGQPGMVNVDSILEFQTPAGGLAFDITASNTRFFFPTNFYGGTAFQSGNVFIYNNIEMVNGGYFFRGAGPKFAINTASLNLYSGSGPQVATWLDNGNLALSGSHSPTAACDLAASTTARASLRIRSGVAPTTPNAGDVWFNGTNLIFFDGSVSRTITWT